MLYGLISSLIGGVTYGLIISLMAAGLSLIYGVMSNVNTSHGMFYMLGGFLAFLASFYLHLPPFFSLLFTCLASFVIGIGVILLIVPSSLRVTTDPDSQNQVMILLLALATATEYVVLLVFGGSSVAVPSMIYGTLTFANGVYITYQTLLASLISVVSYLLLYVFLKFTKVGLGIRAFAQNKDLARAIGIEGERLSLIVFGIGVLLAALSGALLASIFSVNSASGWNELVISFVIVTLGGIGSIFGSLLGGLIYGIAYSIALYYYPSYAFIIVLILIYLVLIIKPTGLLGEIIERV